MENINIHTITHTPVGELTKLSAGQLNDFLCAANESLDNAKRTKQWIESVIGLKYKERLQAKRHRLEKDTGTIHIEDEGFKLTSEISKRPAWDQKKLIQIIADIQKQGDDPSEYVTVTTNYKVPESKYSAWPRSIQKVFDPARTLKTGNPTYSLAPIDQEAA